MVRFLLITIFDVQEIMIFKIRLPSLLLVAFDAWIILAPLNDLINHNILRIHNTILFKLLSLYLHSLIRASLFIFSCETLHLLFDICHISLHTSIVI